MSFANKIREAREDELDALISKAEDNLPHSLTIYGVLSIGFRRKIYNRNVSKVYIPVDDKFPFFIIITEVIIKKRQNMTLYWNPQEISGDVARELLLQVPGWNWEEPFILYSVWTPILHEIEKIVGGENGISKNKLNIWKHYGYCYTIDKNEFSNIVSESDFRLAPLQVKDTEIVYKNWIYNFAEDIEGIKTNIERMPSVAAYDKVQPPALEINGNAEEQEDKEKENFKPISWALTRPYGEIGFNFTFPEYRNKGLSGIVTKELTKKLLEDGIKYPFVNVAGQNPAAVKAIEKIGYRKYSEIGYQFYLSQGMQISDI